jgi:hypothetical protein
MVAEDLQERECSSRMHSTERLAPVPALTSRKSNSSRAAADGSDHAAMRTEQLCDDNLGPILWEVKAGERLADHNPIYKG